MTRYARPNFSIESSIRSLIFEVGIWSVWGMRTEVNSLNKKIIAVLSLAASVVLLASLWMTNVQSVTTNLQIPTEWYRTSGENFVTEQWSWDWTIYETSGPWASGGPQYLLYMMVEDAVFFAYPGGTLMIAAKMGENAWMWSGGGTGKGGPQGAVSMMSTQAVIITFTSEDIPETNSDNGYKGLRMIFEMSQDLYRLVNVGGDNCEWQGWVHQHFKGWATKGVKAN